MVTGSGTLELAQDVLLPAFETEKIRLDVIDEWSRWKPENDIAVRSSKEHRELKDIADSPWLGLVVTTVAQQLVAELVRSSEVEDISKIWLPWQRNRCHSRQRALHRAALTFGYAYSEVLPGDTGAVIRNHSPRNVYAVYADPIVDDYPAYYLKKTSSNGYTLTDDVYVHTLVREQNGSLVYVTGEEHGAGVAPLIRYSNSIDLEARTVGEVEPFIKNARRINKTVYDRLAVQHFNSWKVRTATGLDLGDLTDEERAAEKLKLSNEDILTGGEGVQFDTLDETSMEGFNAAHESDIMDLAAISQTPAHALTGNLANLGADTLAEARSMLDLKAGERKVGFGDSHAQVLRLAAHIEGRSRDANDFSLVISWADLESRSMAQAGDALGKLATMLKIPPELLWDRIPSVTAEEAKSWIEYREKHPSADEQLARTLIEQSNGTNG
ncbi:phage portal protein [Pseudoclavibacter sp. VKM Ac-2888]|uniref:phage portal protein n=1 Tax=Pseudoclavibacter sp. VKM Ac-2888 TaxID=2783830 RepID=UPI00188CFD04|nr:phage portal protein [Pseudoclavibacter sp. VKM Ac-2888]MBF4549679.1 phage portal protein [Pseudoclavibacter sp. VKM Ac-2888]